MIRPVAFVLAMAVAVAVAPSASKPPLPTVPLPQPAPAPHLVPGGMLSAIMVVVIPSPPPPPDRLDSVARAVEGAESSYGRDPLMWRADPRGPQGPMQVSAAAAIDAGGGDRFDIDQNWALGRAYLARMYARYGDWRDTVLSYNWGPGNVDRWIEAGRPADWLSGGLSHYVDRVLDDDDAGDAPMPGGSPAPEAAPEPVHPEVSADSIGDPRLRRRVAANDRMIVQLRIFLDASVPMPLGEAAYSDAAAGWLAAVGIDPQQLAAADAAATQGLANAGAKLVFGIARTVARRPGYGNFAAIDGARRAPDIAAVRLIASVLAEKLEGENAALALVDTRRHGGWPGTSPAKTVHADLVRR